MVWQFPAFPFEIKSMRPPYSTGFCRYYWPSLAVRVARTATYYCHLQQYMSPCFYCRSYGLSASAPTEAVLLFAVCRLFPWRRRYSPFILQNRTGLTLEFWPHQDKVDRLENGQTNSIATDVVTDYNGSSVCPRCKRGQTCDSRAVYFYCTAARTRFLFININAS